jgi:hypothetical protein
MEKKLSKKTRLEILSDALADVCYGEYICTAITDQLEERDILAPRNGSAKEATDSALEYFPDLLRYKPKEADLYNCFGWFGEGGRQSAARRIEVMERLMAEIAEQETELN